MMKCKKLTFAERIRWRIRILWCVLVAMLGYMIFVGETGGDSRIMTPLANIFSRVVFFGGMIYVISRIVNNKKLLQNPYLLKEQRMMEQDERNRYMHDKSGGIVWDILFICLLFVTLTASLYNMAAFYTSFAILALAVLLKLVTYFLYRQIGA